ncbi:hypothetical protein KJ633_02785, partial [bacterium]|nr:hypothetical protein [bacterium]
ACPCLCLFGTELLAVFVTLFCSNCLKTPLMTLEEVGLIISIGSILQFAEIFANISIYENPIFEHL